jgi:hypothetical protein
MTHDLKNARSTQRAAGTGCRWVAVLKELGTASGGLGPAGGVQAAAADEWQQLHLAPFEGIAESSGESPLAIKVRTPQRLAFSGGPSAA